jgi:tetratricopeptide (TPR) repeat protein
MIADRFDACSAYIALSDQFFDHKISERSLLTSVRELSPIDSVVLDQLAQRAEELAAVEPRRGWVLAKVAHSAASFQQCDPYLLAMAGWYLGRAANDWARPKRAQVTISRARRGFQKLGQSGWVAVCDWQLNALPWTRPSFSQAAQTLQLALGVLEDNHFDQFVPHCRLALAYAQVLIGNLDRAIENIRASENKFLLDGDELNLARCWFYEAGCLRRQDRIDDAFKMLEKALRVFETNHAPVDSAKVHYQTALCYLLKTENLSEASRHFEKAIELFSKSDLDLWRAMCRMNLGSVDFISGNLVGAEKQYQNARKSFIRHDIVGLLADNLNDSGELNKHMGRLELSIEQFKQAEQLNEKLGSQLPAAIAITNLGEAYGQSGRYQDALYHLERAAVRLESLKSYLRLGTCERLMALIWSQLGQAEIAHQHLDRASRYYETANHKEILSSVNNYRANIFLDQGKGSNAVECLEKSLSIAEQYGIKPQASLARRLLGEVLIQIGRGTEAVKYLEQAQSDFMDMGMSMEQAASLVALGTAYTAIHDPDRAQAAFEQALHLSAQGIPEVEWRATIGLADLAEARLDSTAAIRYYREGLAVFTKIRRNFWQPALAGSYLQSPARVFDKAISRVSKTGSVPDAIRLIEQSKAATFLRQLTTIDSPTGDPKSQELLGLGAEIGFLQDKLRASFETALPFQSALQNRQIRSQLVEKIKQYDHLKSRLERQAVANPSASRLPQEFNLQTFKTLACNALGEKWVALDYYWTDQQIIITAITPDDVRILNSVVTNRMLMAFDACNRARQNARLPTENDLEFLGTSLIPALLETYLTPDTHLLLAPHKKLHAIPWASLKPGFSPYPLVWNCVPTVVPSLHSLALLLERSFLNRSTNRASGLLVGLSNFKGLRLALPRVMDEIGAIQSRLDSGGQVLSEESATWKNLLKLSGKPKSADRKNNLSRFAWLHIASHFFADTYTGRLSGLALWDGDIWLDQLRDLAPLPNLVTFSACNSNLSFVYAGDEHVDLPSTCLIAGANSVVGNLWPVLDQVAGKFMPWFYEHYLAGLSPALSVALVQRECIRSGENLENWAGFNCIGVP